MLISRVALLAALIAGLPLVAPSGARGQAAVGEESRVRAVLFYSPTCPHCQDVIEEHLPAIAARYGDRLRIVGVDVSTEGGASLYGVVARHFQLPRERIGVPALVVGEVVLVGSAEIPDRLPGLVDTALARGVTGWPAIPELREALAMQGLEEERREDTAAGPDSVSRLPGATLQGLRGGGPRPAPTVGERDRAVPAESFLELRAAAAQRDGVAARFLRDPVANGVAVVVLVAMLTALVLAGLEGAGAAALLPVRTPAPPSWVIPVAAVLGAGVAAYLTFVEATGAAAVCGPVGDCNAVQQSPYARLFGLVPVGALGLIGYGAMLAAWVAGVAVKGRTAERARFALWAMAVIGVILSAYLTFLEPFVIGATCAWCVSSAVLMTVILLAATAWLPTRSGRGESGKRGSRRRPLAVVD